MPARSLTVEQDNEIRASIAAGRTLNEIAARLGVSMRAIKYHCLDNHIQILTVGELSDEPDPDFRAIAMACHRHLRDLLQHHCHNRASTTAKKF